MTKLWDNFPQQKRVVEILKNLYETRRIPHAFIFSGPEGVGKFHSALHFSTLLFSQFDTSSSSKGAKYIASLQEPYVKLIFPLPRGKGETAEDGSIDKLSKEQIEALQVEFKKKSLNPYYKISLEEANTIKINSIRDIKKFIAQNHEEIPLQFIIISDAHLMNEQSQNALLKSLEEPPPGIIFFLLTHEKEKLLPTIHSRCRLVEFEPLEKEAVANILINNFGIEKEAALKAAFFSEGSVTRAVEILEENIDEMLESIIAFLRYSIAKRYYSAFKELTGYLANKSDNEISKLTRLIKTWLADANRNRFSRSDLYFGEFTSVFQKFNDKFRHVNLHDIYSKIDLLESYRAKNLNLNVILLCLIFELAAITIRK